MLTSRFLFQTLLGRTIRAAHRVLSEPFIINCELPNGTLMRHRPSDVTNQLALRNLYGHVIPNVLKKLGLGDFFIDIGANAGVWSLDASLRVGDTGRVIAFEPQSALYQDLVHNISVSRTCNVIAINAAISDSSGISNMVTTDGHSGVAHIGNGELEIRCVSGMSVTQIVLALTQTDCQLFIKIDVEGFEFIIINSLKILLNNSMTKYVIIEINRAYLKRFASTPEMIYAVMQDAGFEYSFGIDFSDHYDEVFVRK